MRIQLGRNRHLRNPPAESINVALHTRSIIGSHGVKPTRCLISLFWLSGLLSPALLDAAHPPDRSLAAYVQGAQHRQAYGIYVKQRKLGWAIDEVKLGQYAGREVAVQTYEEHWRYTAGGEVSHGEARTVNYYELEGKGEIVFAVEEVTEDGTTLRRTASRVGKQMAVTTVSRGVETQRDVPVPKATLARARELDDWLKKGPAPGSRFTNYSTEWGEERIDQEEITTIRGKKDILWGGVKTTVFLVNLADAGAITEAEITADGTIIKGHLSGVFEIRAEKEALASQPASGMVDLLTASSIPVDRDLGDPAKVLSLTLEITATDRFELPVSHRQRVRWHRGKTTIVELSKDHRVKRPTQLSAGDRARYVKSTPACQSEHETIRQLAGRIVGDTRDTLERAAKLRHWVFANVRSTMAANASTALDVLTNRAGDCTEHTLLFVALARALDIPAREVSGVMYMGEGQPAFGWHAWAEIHDGHQWISIDPTWDQSYVDATHLALSENTDDWSWVNAVGQMKFHVLKSQAR